MPPITITLTEFEACYIREMVQESTVARKLMQSRTSDSDLNRQFIELNDGIVEKLKDA